MNEEEKQDLISSYLLGQLKGQNLQKFTLRLMRDQSFQEEVDKERIVMKTLWRENQKAAATRSASSQWLLFLLIAVFAGGLLTYLLSGNEKAPTINESPIEENNASSTMPIAANMAINPTLEMLRNNPTRSTLFQVVLDDPEDEAVFTNSQGDDSIKLLGQLLIGAQDAPPTEVIGYVFSNKEEDFDDFKPILSQTIVPTKITEQTYSIDWEIPLSSFVTGRYYLLIGDALEEELLLTQTFTIE